MLYMFIGLLSIVAMCLSACFCYDVPKLTELSGKLIACYASPTYGLVSINAHR